MPGPVTKSGQWSTLRLGLESRCSQLSNAESLHVNDDHGPDDIVRRRTSTHAIDVMARSLAGLCRLTRMDENVDKDRDTLSTLYAFRTAKENSVRKNWYLTSLNTGNCAMKLGVLCIDSGLDNSCQKLLHDLCFVDGTISFGMPCNSDVRFLVEAKRFSPLTTAFDDRNEMIFLPHSVSISGLSRRISFPGRDCYHEMYAMNNCIFSGRPFLMRMLYVQSLYMIFFYLFYSNFGVLTCYFQMLTEERTPTQDSF